MLKKLLFFSLFIVIIYMWTSSCSAREPETEEDGTGVILPDVEVSLQGSDTSLQKTEDAGQSYIDSFIFLGESTTYHLKSRGVLSGGKDTKQVWAPKSGTLMLDPSTASCRILYPDTNEELDISDAMAKKKPKYLLLTFGLNGAVGNMSKGSEYFKSCYKKLISRLEEASPDTVIMLQSCFPVSKDMDTSNYSVSADVLNSYIERTNEWTSSLAKECGLPYLNTADSLKDENGFLKSCYDSGDGFHLNAEAYREVLRYIRTHAYGG